MVINNLSFWSGPEQLRAGLTNQQHIVQVISERKIRSRLRRNSTLKLSAQPWRFYLSKSAKYNPGVVRSIQGLVITRLFDVIAVNCIASGDELLAVDFVHL